MSGGQATIELPWTAPPLSMNDRGRTRGAAMAKNRRIAEVREQMYVLAHKAKLPRDVRHVTVALHYRPRDRRRRDTDNLVATLKPLCDALAEGRPASVSRNGRPVPALVGYGMVPDDIPAYMAKPEPTIHPVEKGKAAAMWLELTWQE
ncbi:hypothetical protein AB0L97_32850 [Nocardia sp. NPDC051911]|uniref:hypothetical protein n=1 Tax=Nocardia sp. NPDC051911 TaxID=3154648 RepID=UPI00342CB736